MCNSYCEYKDGILFIRPLNQVSKARELMSEGGAIMLKSVRMKYVAAASVLEQLKPFLASEANARLQAQSNSILLIDTADNVSRMMEIIDELDKGYKDGWYRVVLPCNNVSAEAIKSELKQIMPVLGIQVVEGPQIDVTPGAIHLTSLSRVRVLIASASAIEPLEELRKWVGELNRLENEDKTNAYVYKVVNSDASQLLSELAVLFPNLTGQVLNASNGGTKTVNGVAAAQNSELTTTADNIFTYPVRISANMEYNRLLIMASPKAYSIIRALLARLDTIPPQVLLQIMVVQIELTDSNSFGMEWNAQSTIGGEKMGFGTDYLDLKPGSNTEYGGKIHVYDPNNPDSQFLYIKALAGKSKLKVISSPQVLVRSQTKAEVSVGKEVPVLYADITDTSSTTGDNTAIRRSYQYKKTGIILTVTPTISVGGLISMDISQTISDVIKSTTDTLDTPTIKNDQITTELLLRNGRTIIMGGLIRDRMEESLSSIPGIAEIPMLNWLTGDSSRSNERTEILMLITATIIDEQTTLEEMVRRYSDSLREINVFENNVYAPYDKRFEEAQAKGLLTVERANKQRANASEADGVGALTLQEISAANEVSGIEDEQVVPMESVAETPVLSVPNQPAPNADDAIPLPEVNNGNVTEDGFEVVQPLNAE